MSPGPAIHGSIDRCVACAEPLAHDQKYCLNCGIRRGPLPAPITAALGELAGRRAVAPPPSDPPGDPANVGDEPDDPDAADDGRDRLGDLIPLARAAAVSILLMLGVGSVIGAATSQGGVESLAKTIVVAFRPANPPPATRLASTGGGGGGGAASGGGSGGGGSGSAAPATVTQQTVTISQTAAPGSGGGGSTTATTPTSTTASAVPPIGHVWEIVLSDQGYGQSFGTTKGHAYLSKTLVDEGELISQYDAVAASPLANEIALISGQGPTPQTLADCPQYSDILPARTGKLGQVLGAGCLYPAATQTLGQQLQIAGKKWRAYVQGIGDPGQTKPPTTSSTTTPTATTTTGAATTAPQTTVAATTSTTATTPTVGQTSTSTSGATSTGSTTVASDTSAAAGCPHPAEGAADPAQSTRAGDGYVTWKNPWVYFNATVTSTSCATDDVGLAQLAKNLRKQSTTPAFSYIAPDPCDDGSDTPCHTGATGGLARADAFLKTVVPEIERSAAYKDNGLILITFDQAPQSGPEWSTASCCGQPTYPNLAALTTTTPTTTGTVTTITAAPATTTTATTTTAPATAGATTTSTGTTPASTTCPTTTSTTTTDPTTTDPTTSDPTTSDPTTTTATTNPTGTTTTGCLPAITGDPPGGGQVGLLMISPYIKPDTVNTIETYNHYSLLKSIENLFGLSHLGYAADKQVPAFIPSLFLSTKR